MSKLRAVAALAVMALVAACDPPAVESVPQVYLEASVTPTGPGVVTVERLDLRFAQEEVAEEPSDTFPVKLKDVVLPWSRQMLVEQGKEAPKLALTLTAVLAPGQGFTCSFTDRVSHPPSGASLPATAKGPQRVTLICTNGVAE